MILHISTPKSWRGGEQQLAYLASGLHEQGMGQLFVCAAGGAMESWCMENEFTVFPINTGPLSMVTNAMLVNRVCRNYKVRLIHVHDSKAHTIAWLSALLGNKTPIIVSRKVDFPVGGNIFSRKKYNHKNIVRFICVSEKVKEILSASLKNPSKAMVIYDGVETRLNRSDVPLDLHEEFDIPDNYFIIGNIAALAPHKDYFTWLRTAGLLLHTGQKQKFIIVGTGPLEKEIRDFIQEMKLEKDVIMTGFREDAKAVLAGLDLLFISSDTEGLGSTILDAFVRKIPVVATEAGGIPEIVKDSETGLLAPVKNPMALASAIHRLLNHEPLKNKVVEQAYAFVQHLDWRIMAEKTRKVYEELMER